MKLNQSFVPQWHLFEGLRTAAAVLCIVLYRCVYCNCKHNVCAYCWNIS